MPKIVTNPINRKLVRQALRCWDNSQQLGVQPLAKIKAVEAQRRASNYGSTPTAYGVALRDLLHKALDKIKPEGDVDLNDKRWRPYLILQSQYVEGRAPDYLLEQFNIARSTYDHEQAEAFEKLVGILQEWDENAVTHISTERASPFLAPPRSTQPLIGRNIALRDLTQHLKQLHTVALNGLPGVGKTALAIHLAHDPEIITYFSGGILWASLGQQPDLLGTLGLWAVALGLPLDEIAKLTHVEERARVIHAAIGLRQMLLVIDDVWEIEEALTFKIGGANCAYLLTTRLPKIAHDFAGETGIAIRELDDDDGLDLLSYYGVDVTEAEARSLITAVGGLPLALTLMGHYLQKEMHGGQPRRMRSALDRLQKIGERLTLSQTRSPLEARPEVPLSLLTVIAATDDVLDDEARFALRSLSIFPPKPNTFSEEAALAICRSSPQALDTLTDYGLLEIVSQRYTLHQTIREYALMQNAKAPALSTSGIEEDVRYLFTSHYIRFLAEAKKDQVLDPELANLFVALTLAYELGMKQQLIDGVNALYPFLETRGLQARLEVHLQYALDAAREINDPLGLSCTLGNYARVWQRRDEYTRAETFYQEALTIARSLDNYDQISAMLSGLGVLAFNRGDYVQAELNYQEGLTLARKHNLTDRLSGLLANMGALALNRSDVVQAESYLQEGLMLARAQHYRSRVSALLINLGVVAARSKNYARADAFFQESLELARGANHREAILFLLANLGTLANDQRDGAKADTYFQEALALAREMDDRARISHLLANVGAIAAGRKDFQYAETCYVEGLTVARAIGHRENITLLLWNWGETKRAQGAMSQAENLYREALTLAQEMGHQRYESMIREALKGLVS